MGRVLKFLLTNPLVSFDLHSNTISTLVQGGSLKDIAHGLTSPLSNVLPASVMRPLLQATAIIAPAFGGYGRLVGAAAAVELAIFYRPKLPKPDTAGSAVRSPTPARNCAYGKSRMFGAMVRHS